MRLLTSDIIESSAAKRQENLEKPDDEVSLDIRFAGQQLCRREVHKFAMKKHVENASLRLGKDEINLNGIPSQTPNDA